MDRITIGFIIQFLLILFKLCGDIYFYHSGKLQMVWYVLYFITESPLVMIRLIFYWKFCSIAFWLAAKRSVEWITSVCTFDRTNCGAEGQECATGESRLDTERSECVNDGNDTTQDESNLLNDHGTSSDMEENRQDETESGSGESRHSIRNQINENRSNSETDTREFRENSSEMDQDESVIAGSQPDQPQTNGKKSCIERLKLVKNVIGIFSATTLYCLLTAIEVAIMICVAMNPLTIAENLFDCCGKSDAWEYHSRGEEIPKSCCTRLRNFDIKNLTLCQDMRKHYIHDHGCGPLKYAISKDLWDPFGWWIGLTFISFQAVIWFVAVILIKSCHGGVKCCKNELASPESMDLGSTDSIYGNSASSNRKRPCAKMMVLFRHITCCRRDPNPYRLLPPCATDETTTDV